MLMQEPGGVPVKVDQLVATEALKWLACYNNDAFLTGSPGEMAKERLVTMFDC